jgi:hypothetical protein
MLESRSAESAVMKEAPEQAFELYIQHGVGTETPLSPSEFAEFWKGLDSEDRDYWMEQLRRGPTRLSREFFAGFTSSAEEPLDAELLKTVGDRLRSLGAFSDASR